MEHNSLSNNHGFVSFTYVSQIARLAATGFEPTDKHKVAFQSSNDTYWILVNTSTPTWAELPVGSQYQLTGIAGGSLNGTFPNPGVEDNSHEHTPGVTIPIYPTTLPPNGPAGGDLDPLSSYPNPTLKEVTGLTAGRYIHPTLTVDAKGRVTQIEGRDTVSVSSNYAILPENKLILVDSTLGNVTVSLPSASLSSLLDFKIVKISAPNLVTINVSSLASISGQSEIVLQDEYSVCDVSSDGSEYFLSSRFELTNNVIQVNPNLITADTTFYVRSDGNDNNDGLSNFAAGAFLTLGAALDTLYKTVINDCTITINIVTSNGFNLNVPELKPLAGSGKVVIQSFGPKATVTNSLIIRDSNSWTVKDFILKSTAGSGLQLINSHAVLEDVNIDLNVIGIECIKSYLSLKGTITWVGTNNYPIVAKKLSLIEIDPSAVINFGSSFIVTTTITASQSAIHCAGSTVQGSVTGKRYSAVLGGVIDTQSSDLNFFPGSTVGTTDATSVYT